MFFSDFMVSLNLPRDWTEQIIWFFVFAIGGSFAGRFIASILFDGRIARALFTKLFGLASIAVWAVYYAELIDPSTVEFYWRRYGRGILEDMLDTVSDVLSK